MANDAEHARACDFSNPQQGKFNVAAFASIWKLVKKSTEEVNVEADQWRGATRAKEKNHFDVESPNFFFRCC